MKRLAEFVKKETVLCVAALAAIISMLLVPPDKEYLGYIDFSVIGTLFCLMTVVAGFMGLGLFDVISYRLLKSVKSTKALAISLVLITFFASMLITNDVSLITLVPLTIGLFSGRREQLIFVTVMETAAANLGSMMTPIGNPQNLFLYSHYNMGIGEFFSVVLPIGLSGLLLIVITILFFRGGDVEMTYGEAPKIERQRQGIVYAVMFILCLLTVLRVLPWYICTAAVLLGVLITDRSTLRRVDYSLLFTFAAFFIFVGNMGRLPALKDFIASAVSGREVLGGILLSQIISNVPAAVMLSAFTDNGAALLAGTNIGGLGTLIASLASLISYKLYAAHDKGGTGKYLFIFTVVNVIYLVILGGGYLLFNI